MLLSQWDSLLLQEDVLYRRFHYLDGICKSSYWLSCANHMSNSCTPTLAILGEPRPAWQCLAMYYFQDGVLSPVSLFTTVLCATCTNGVARHPDKLHLSHAGILSDSCVACRLGRAIAGRSEQQKPKGFSVHFFGCGFGNSLSLVVAPAP